MSSSADWFARKLAADKATAPVSTRPAPVAPVPRPYQAPTPPVGPVSTPLKARSAQENNTCPECYSENYMKPPGTNAGLRCFDCGYPIVQSTSGLSGVKTEGPTRPARQPAPGSGYQPGVIIGRIE